MTTLISQNPYSLEINGTCETLSREALDRKIERAHNAFLTWRKTPKSEKRQLFLNLAQVIENHREELATLQTKEMGMLYSASYAGMGSTIKLIRWFTENFERLLENTIETTNGTTHEFQYDPLGVIYGVAPWNFPFNQVLRAAVPNILAGNTVLYKHASNTPLAGIRLEELFLEAGFPIGIYQNIVIPSAESEYILSRKEIRGVNLTGSEGAGRSIGALAGKYLKPSVLELGGNDAFIVAHTKNLEAIAKEAMKARISNNWQKCNSSKRFIVMEEYYDAFLGFAKKAMEWLIIGDPMLPETELGPLARADLVDEIDAQVQKTISEWARLITGWKKWAMKGYFYLPTILADVTPDMTSYKEEIFGPVASVIRVKNIEEAIEVANNSDFWLCGCVYGDDEAELKIIARQIETGMVFLNKPAASQAHLPFGGVKLSWYGKENGPDWLKAFTNKKVVVY